MRVFTRLPNGTTIITGGIDEGEWLESPTSPAVSAVMEVEELADVLGLNRKTVYSAIKSGEIPGVLRVRGRVLLSRHKVERWLAGEERVPSSRRNPR